MILSTLTRMLLVSLAMSAVIWLAYKPSVVAGSWYVDYAAILTIQLVALLLARRAVEGKRKQFIIRTLAVSVLTSGMIVFVLRPFDAPGLETVFLTVTAIEFGGFLAIESTLRNRVPF